MSEQQFEIAFSGQIAAGADLATVKQHIGKIFKADAAKLAQMFSGHRIIIKHSVDQATAAKYRGAFQKAGAVCEVRALGGADAAAAQPASVPPAASASATTQSAGQTEPYQSRYAESDVVPQALLTDPLGIQGDQIDDLGLDIAPVGSRIQDNYAEAAEPNIDISGMAMAPVGATLDQGSEEAPPPLPDTSGLTLAD